MGQATKIILILVVCASTRATGTSRELVSFSHSLQLLADSLKPGQKPLHLSHGLNDCWFNTIVQLAWIIPPLAHALANTKSEESPLKELRALFAALEADKGDTSGKNFNKIRVAAHKALCDNFLVPKGITHAITDKPINYRDFGNVIKVIQKGILEGPDGLFSKEASVSDGVIMKTASFEDLDKIEDKIPTWAGGKQVLLLDVASQIFEPMDTTISTTSEKNLRVKLGLDEKGYTENFLKNLKVARNNFKADPEGKTKKPTLAYTIPLASKDKTYQLIGMSINQSMGSKESWFQDLHDFAIVLNDAQEWYFANDTAPYNTVTPEKNKQVPFVTTWPKIDGYLYYPTLLIYKKVA